MSLQRTPKITDPVQSRFQFIHILYKKTFQFFTYLATLVLIQVLNQWEKIVPEISSLKLRR